MKHERHQDEQIRPNRGYVGHQHEQQHDPAQHSSHEQHAGHDKHAGHSPEIFKRRFFICLVLTLPILYFEPMFQTWFNYQAIQFSGAEWVIPIFSTIIYC
jgi:P-type Cu2+ transporter